MLYSAAIPGGSVAIYAFGSFTRDRTYGIAGVDVLSGCRLISWHLEVAGGNAGNVLRTVAAAGTDARAIGALGKDRAGQFVRECLADAGVDVARLPLLSGASTKEVLALVDSQTGSHEFFFLDGNEASYSAPINVTFDGSDVLVVDEASDHSIRLSAQAKESGCAVFFNMGSFKGNVAALMAIADWIVCSADLLNAAHLDPISRAAAERLVVTNSHAEVVLTLGAEGLLYRSGNVEKRQEAVRATVISTIGAGDTTVAALVLGRQLALSIDDSLRWAAHMAAACCTKEDSALTSAEILAARQNAGIAS